MRLLLVTSIMQTLCYLKIFRLSKEYSAQIILDGNNQSHKRIGSTSITWPSIQSVKPVKEGFAFIISPNFGSITILFILCKNTQNFSKYQIFSGKSIKKMIFPVIFSGLFVFLHRYKYKFFICQNLPLPSSPQLQAKCFG